MPTTKKRVNITISKKMDRMLQTLARREGVPVATVARRLLEREMQKKEKTVLEYTAMFEKDEQGGGYTVTVPDLPGCISEGDSFEEAVRNIKEAMELYLEDGGTQQEKQRGKENFQLQVPIRISV